jgi:hypothetical protein
MKEKEITKPRTTNLESQQKTAPQTTTSDDDFLSISGVHPSSTIHFRYQLPSSLLASSLLHAYINPMFRVQLPKVLSIAFKAAVWCGGVSTLGQIYSADKKLYRHEEWRLTPNHGGSSPTPPQTSGS